MHGAQALLLTEHAVDNSSQPFDHDDRTTALLLQAAVLMQNAIDLLDMAGEIRAALHLQHAIDTLAMQLPEYGQPN